MVVNSVEDDFTFQETTTIHIEDDVGVTSEAPQLEEANAGVLVYPEGEMVVERTLDDGPISARQEEASSSMPTVDVSPAVDDRGKIVIDKGDESSSDMDPNDLRMIDERLTQIEARME